MPSDLTQIDRLNKLMEYLTTYKVKNDGIAPTVREIQMGCGYASTSMVQRDLDTLEIYGHISRIHARIASRSIILIGGKYIAPGVGDAAKWFFHD